MVRTLAEIIQQAEQLADLTEADTANGTERDAAPTRALIAAFSKRAQAEREIRAAVHLARTEGYSWQLIGSLIGTSGQAARERYGTQVPERRPLP